MTAQTAHIMLPALESLLSRRPATTLDTTIFSPDLAPLALSDLTSLFVLFIIVSLSSSLALLVRRLQTKAICKAGQPLLQDTYQRWGGKSSSMSITRDPL